MDRIKTWAQLKAELRTELKITSDTTDVATVLLALANEALAQIAQQGKDLREARLDERIAIVANPLVITTLAIATIDQIMYVNGASGWEWALAEQQGVPMPPAVSGLPNAYTIKTSAGSVNFPTYTITFYPVNGSLLDEIRIIGTGFTHITDDSTVLYFFPYYAAIKLYVATRWQSNYLNLGNDKLQATLALKGEIFGATLQGTQDSGNLENPSRETKQ